MAYASLWVSETTEVDLTAKYAPVSEKCWTQFLHEMLEQVLPLVWGSESLQTCFKEIQRLEKEGRAGSTDRATQESLDHWM
jgi:hypothetical protein